MHDGEHVPLSVCGELPLRALKRSPSSVAQASQVLTTHHDTSHQSVVRNSAAATHRAHVPQLLGRQKVPYAYAYSCVHPGMEARHDARHEARVDLYYYNKSLF